MSHPAVSLSCFWRSRLWRFSEHLGRTRHEKEKHVTVEPRSQPAVLASVCCLFAKTWTKFRNTFVVSVASERHCEHADTT